MLAKRFLIALAFAMVLPVGSARSDTSPPLVVLGNLGNPEAYRRTEAALNERLQQFVDWMADHGVEYRRVQLQPGGDDLQRRSDNRPWPDNTVAMLWVYRPGEEPARFRLPAHIDIGRARTLRFHPVRAIIPRTRADDERRANISMYEAIILYALLLRAAEDNDPRTRAQSRRKMTLIGTYLTRFAIPRAQSESLTMSLACIEQIRRGIRDVGRPGPPGNRNLAC